ncbi:DUF3726 domain-containing protein [uncultured Roseobacter sp.]|uniref:DUF3726 domain-containing protein n=1 Tax=uncultured Roseobacter sp. TaxID=114847 RepID=UPI0026204C42|nr:DUF3726 domain-containing protein [uncultured Roseobacter sp.]
MNLSLNEVEATARKAARGAGYPWGLAEETGKATRWLCAQGLEGCAVLARLLARVDGATISDLSPKVDELIWQAPGPHLCPLVTGAALSDRVSQFDHGAFRTGPIAEPCLLFPFVSYLARKVERVVEIEWRGGGAIFDAGQMGLTGATSDFADQVAIRFGGTLRSPRARCTRADPGSSAWDALLAFAHRTYAPATEESRLKGAGAEMGGSE